MKGKAEGEAASRQSDSARPAIGLCRLPETAVGLHVCVSPAYLQGSLLLSLNAFTTYAQDHIALLILLPQARGAFSLFVLFAICPLEFRAFV